MTKHSPDPALRAAAKARALARYKARKAADPDFRRKENAKRHACRKKRLLTDPAYAARYRQRASDGYRRRREQSAPDPHATWVTTGQVKFRAVNVGGLWPRFEREEARAQWSPPKADMVWRRKKHLVHSAKRRAREAGVPFDLDARKINWPDRCPVLGIEFNWASQKDNPDVWSRPSIDRIRPGEGYTLDNIQIVSFRANTVRGNATPAELRAVADYFEMFHG